MKIALIGVTGNVGTRIAAELLKRGHQITGIARNPSKIASRPGLSVEEGDVKDEAKLAQLLRGRDVVIHSVKFESTDVNNVIGAAKKAGVRRLWLSAGPEAWRLRPVCSCWIRLIFPQSTKLRLRQAGSFSRC